MGDTKDDAAGGKFISDMDEHGSLRKDVWKIAEEAAEKSKEECLIAQKIKEALDKKYGPCWHCIVGSDFRCQCSHNAKTFMFFYIGKLAVCVYQTSF